MTSRLQNTINVLVPTGALGTGVREADLTNGIAAGAHAIACDAGSTDSGPAYLATGTPKYSREAVKADLRLLMLAQAQSRLPLLIGSCGTSGADVALNWTSDIALEIAREERLSQRITLLYSEVSPERVVSFAEAGKVTPLPPLETVDNKLFAACDRIVALMGPEPYMDAVEQGADIVLGGRTTDTAVIAAVPLLRGADKGPAWHAGKIAECGGLCTTHSRQGGVLIRVGDEAFEVEPLSSDNQCTPYSVSAHMLYENSDPFRLIEPGGVLDVRNARYSAIDERVVQVTGSQWEERPYTMKLEGAGAGPFQTIMLVGIQDRTVLANLGAFLAQMERLLLERTRATLGAVIGVFDISLRAYGWNAVSGAVIGDPEPPPREIGLLFVATAETQAKATRIAKTCNPMFFHMPLRPDMELPSYAFPFSPAEIERGQVHEFLLNHVVAVGSPVGLVRQDTINFDGQSNA